MGFFKNEEDRDVRLKDMVMVKALRTSEKIFLLSELMSRSTSKLSRSSNLLRLVSQ